jgi:hypothetical protein
VDATTESHSGREALHTLCHKSRLWNVDPLIIDAGIVGTWVDVRESIESERFEVPRRDGPHPQVLGQSGGELVGRDFVTGNAESLLGPGVHRPDEGFEALPICVTREAIDGLDPHGQGHAIGL